MKQKYKKWKNLRRICNDNTVEISLRREKEFLRLRKHSRIIMLRDPLLTGQQFYHIPVRVRVGAVFVHLACSRNFENMVAPCRRRDDGRNAPRWRNRDSDIGCTSVRHWVLAMNINVLKQLNRRRAGGSFALPAIY